jgi:electron transport complex protein RnfD
MWTVVACLVPPLVLSVFIFGIQTLIITAVSVASCVAVEAHQKAWAVRSPSRRRP